MIPRKINIKTLSTSSRYTLAHWQMRTLVLKNKMQRPLQTKIIYRKK